MAIFSMLSASPAHEFPTPPDGFVHIRKKEDSGNYTDHFIRSDQVVAITIFQQPNGHILQLFTSIMKSDEIPMSIRLLFKDHEDAAAAAAKIFDSMEKPEPENQEGE